jgi:hypothetical protein
MVGEDEEAARAGLSQTAIHEAGHAVPTFFRGRRLYSVSVIEDDDSFGRMVHGRILSRLGVHGIAPSGRQRRGMKAVEAEPVLQASLRSVGLRHRWRLRRTIRVLRRAAQAGQAG